MVVVGHERSQSFHETPVQMQQFLEEPRMVTLYALHEHCISILRSMQLKMLLSHDHPLNAIDAQQLQYW